MAGTGQWVTAFVPAASCWRGQVSVSSPKLLCMNVYVFVCVCNSLAIFKLDQLASRGGSGPGWVSGGESICAGIWEDLRVWGACGTSQPTRRRRLDSLCLCLCESSMWVLFKAAPYLWQCV